MHQHLRLPLFLLILLSLNLNVSIVYSASYQTCPPINKLHKDFVKMIWFAPGGWKSFSPSFSPKIGHFLGAQWQGVNVGNIFCLYKGTENMSFPILLEYNRLAYAPYNGHWSKNLGGYSNCKSHRLKDCLFNPQPSSPIGNIYQQVSQLKNTHAQEIGF